MSLPAPEAEPEGGPSRSRTIVRIFLRLIVVVVAVGLAGFALFNIFDDLDFDEIRSALDRLSDAEWLALTFAWMIWIGSQGLQTASLVHALPARRGVLAYLGPSAVASLIPGPSDLPVRYAMYQSWGVSNAEAATAVAASGIFSVGSQLALPALAGLFILFADVPLEGFTAFIVIATGILAALVVLGVFIVGSPERTRRAGELANPAWLLGHRLARKPAPDRDFGMFLAENRQIAADHLRDKWLPTTGATILTIVTKCSLLVMALRFVGIPEDVLGWTAIFVVFGLVAGLTIVPITPGSAGVAELALVGLLTPIAGSEYVNEVAAGVLLYRLLTWILLIPAGLVVLAAWQVGHRRNSSNAS